MKIVAILLIGLMVLPAMSFAGEDPVTGSVKTVAKAIQGTVAAGESSIEALAKGKPADAVADPVNKTGETVYQATENTGKALTCQTVD
ncbi:hypothetical protein ACFL4E_02660 [Candidatus Omnitrophota bacterium]